LAWRDPDTVVHFWRDNFEKWGPKVKVGVAHFRVHTLPVQLDARCITGPLEAEWLINTVFVRCWFLLPVSSYGGLKFSEGRNFGGTLLPKYGPLVATLMGGERGFRVLVFKGKNEKSFRRKLVVFAYENWKNTKKHVFEISHFRCPWVNGSLRLFRGRRSDKNSFWTKSISTSGFELWGFEIFRRSLLWGQITPKIRHPGSHFYGR